MNPETTLLLDCHRYVYHEYDVEVVLERFAEDSRDGLKAEVTVTTTRPPRPGLLYQGRLNLSSARSRAEITKALAKRTTKEFLNDVDFAGILEQVCFLSTRQWREGDPTVCLADVAPRTGARYLLYPYLEFGAINLLFGDGASAKSTVGLAEMVSLATGRNLLDAQPVVRVNGLYLDWESDPETHHERMLAICHAADIAVPSNVYYRRMVAPLAESDAVVRKEIARLDVGFVIADSVGMAGGDEPEKAGTKIPLFNAARSFGVTFLGIDHVNKVDPSKPYGSVYTRNIVRLAWAVEKAQKEGDDCLKLLMRNEKSNNGRLEAKRGLQVDYLNTTAGHLESIAFSACEVSEIAQFRKSLPHWEQIMAVLQANQDSPMPAEDIAIALEIDGINLKVNAIRAEMSRHPSVFESVFTKGVTLYRLRPNA